MRRGHGHSERGRKEIQRRRHRHSLHLHGHSQQWCHMFRRLKTIVLTFVVLVVVTSLDLIRGQDLGVEVEENYGENEEQQQQNNLSDMIQNRLTQDNHNKVANDRSSSAADGGARIEEGEKEGYTDGGEVEEEDPSSFYFYLNDSEASKAVTEFEAAPVVGGGGGESSNNKPSFLYNPTHQDHKGEIRIVEFYSHWCPHCKKFFPRYVALAQRVQELLEQQQTHTQQQVKVVKFYAVSCVPHKRICRDFDIHGYPRVLFFEDGSTDGIEMSKTDLHPFGILRKIPGGIIDDNNNTRDEKFDMILNSNSRNHHDEEKSGAVTSSSDFWLSRTKADIYNDAYLSFVFACRHSIYVGRPPLAEDAKSAFRKWILLLQKTLPPTWKLSTLIDDIEENLDLVLEDEDELDKVVSRHPPEVTTWSDSCSRGDSSQGYTCGLWQLFHIMTIGYVQWMMNNVGDKKMYSTDYVGETLSDYIEHFFGCEVCRENFMVEYETCAFGRCDRLSTKKSKDVQDWNELPLWLHELHNGVNVRLMKEKAEREGRTVSDTELEAVLWPARHDCPSCWNDDGSWNPDTILQFMLLFYWPEELIPKDSMPGLLSGISGKDFLDLGGTIEEEAKVASWVYSLVGFLVFSFILSAASWVKKRREIVRTGYHKKKDDSPIADQV